ncbi:MAG: nitroreductase family protein [Blautia massiliensis (ex Durand et al. 2017)]
MAIENKILMALHARKSVRVYREEYSITKPERTAILRAAFDAPTAGGQQLYTILDITDPDLRHTVAELCDHQPFIEKAALCLVFLADCRRWPRAYAEAGVEQVRRPGPGDLMLAVADACIAAQNAVTAAESIGFGSCYIGDVLENNEAMREALKLPEYVVPACMVVFGRPTNQQMARMKPARFREQAVVCENTYRDRTGDELRQDFIKRAVADGKDKAAFDVDQYLKDFCARKYESDFSREMNRSAREYWKQFE